jgi:hypothetical protein
MYTHNKRFTNKIFRSDWNFRHSNPCTARVFTRLNVGYGEVEEILPELTHAKIFPILVAKNSFWHLKLDEESKKMSVECQIQIFTYAFWYELSTRNISAKATPGFGRF